MAWCEGNRVDFVFGLPRSARRIKFALASACPYAVEWRLAAARLAPPA